MEESPPIVLFDFDGVIADTFAIAAGVARKLCVYVDEQQYRKLFENNFFKAQDTIAAADHGDPCDHALDWVSTYRPHFHAHAKPFPGIPETLRTIAEKYRIIVVSSAHSSLIEHFLDKHDLRACIAEVMGHDVGLLKSDKFRTIVSTYGIAPNETVFVTDTLGDINEAGEVGISSIGVAWGFQDRETLQRGEPFRIVEKPLELPDAIADFFARA